MQNRITKYSIFFLAISLLVAGCKPEIILHDLKGEPKAPWFEPIPYGMSYIPQGTFKMGATDDPINQPLELMRNVSVSSFWMDDTEITNNEYRQYINWATDSVAADLTFNAGIDYYRGVDRDKQIIEPPTINRFMISQIWTDDRQDVLDALEPLFYQGKERFLAGREIDYRKVFYRYATINLNKAAQRANSYNYETQSYNGVSSRQDFIDQHSVPVYPDTLVWVRDFTYSYNEPWTLKYFHHPAFYEYPVVGVTWEQANAFCHWRTENKKTMLASYKILPIHDYRLPTEAEWEYAARGGKMNNKYPWGNYYTSNEKGCYMANFKPLRGNYVATSHYTTKSMKVGSFDPNDFGLYDMAGNVAEWTYTAYDINGYEMMHDMNPSITYNAKPDDPPAMKRKVIRGGSWKDVAHYIQVSTRDYEYQDSATSYVGFRCVMNAIEDERKTYR